MLKQAGIEIGKVLSYSVKLDGRETLENKAIARVQDEMIEQVSMSFEEMSKNVNGLIADIEGIDNMLASLSEANNQIVDNIMQLSATTEEVTASALQSSELTEENSKNSREARDILSGILEVSHKMDKYIS